MEANTLIPLGIMLVAMTFILLAGKPRDPDAH